MATQNAVWLAVLAGCLATPFGMASAAPLGKEACDAIEAERATLAATGIGEAVQKGPAWAKANLPPGRLKDVERYIGLQEQLLFRCGHAKLRTLPIPEPEDGADGQPQPAKDAPASDEPAKQKPKAAPKKAKQSVEAGGGAEPQKPATKPRPKPKADDAYRPPQKADIKTE